MTRYASSRDGGSLVPRSTSSPPPGRRHTTFARLVGALGMMVLTALLFWLLTDDAFRVTDSSVTFEGLAHADEAEVRDGLVDIDREPNVFRVRASEIVGELSVLTEVDAAYATVTLPADVSVYLDERDPVFVWTNGRYAWLVDAEGMLFAPADALDPDAAADPEASPDPKAVLSSDVRQEARDALPVVVDDRLFTEDELDVGSYLSATDQLVMRQLLAVTPELLDSDASALAVRVDENVGYTLEAVGRPWRALFGPYTPLLHPPEQLPRQVQCLRAVLEAEEEKKLDEIRLVPSESSCGTFTRLDPKREKGG